MSTPCRRAAPRPRTSRPGTSPAFLLCLITAGSLCLADAPSTANTVMHTVWQDGIHRVDFASGRLDLLELSVGNPISESFFDHGEHVFQYGLAIDPQANYLYRVYATEQGGELMRTDLSTGVVDYMGPEHSPWTGGFSIPINSFGASGLSFDPVSRSLYSLDVPTNEVVKIDPTTGQGEILGNLHGAGLSSDFADNLIFHPHTGVAYVMAPSDDLSKAYLCTVDLSTLEATKGPEVVVHDGSGFHFQSMAFDPMTGQLIANLFNEPHFYTVDLETGETARADAYLPDYLPDDVLRWGYGDFGFVASVPEPTGALLTAMGGLLLAHKPRR